MKAFIALLAGIIFGLGLTISEMTNPTVVINFLDITGNWDPRLLFVMISALLVTSLGFYAVLKRHKPLFSETFTLPLLVHIDKRLIIGALCFGVGWGISGYCPGPVIAGVSINPNETLPFILAMVVGMKIANWQKHR